MAVTQNVESVAREQALAHLKLALDLWQVDPDQATGAEQKAWADLLDVAETLARLMKVEGPVG